MAFVTSTEAFSQMFDDEKSISEQLMDTILAYLRSHQYVVRLQLLYKWIIGGGGLSTFRCRRDVLDSMASTIGIRGIPFLVIRDMEGNTGMMIKTEDSDAVLDCTQQVLTENAKYCKITSVKGLMDSLKEETYNHRGVISITGLTAAQIYLLEQMAMKDMDLTAIGEDQMSDGTYRFSIQGKRALDHRKRNIGYLLMQMILMTNGPGKAKNTAKAANRYAYHRTLAAAMRSGNFNPVYIVEDKTYMKLSPEGFECGKIITEQGTNRLDMTGTFPKALPDYQAQLISHIGAFSDPVCTTDLAEVYARAAKEGSFDLTEPETERLVGEIQLAEKLTEVVMNKTEKDTTMASTGQFATKANHLITEMGRVFTAALNNTIPLGYTEQAINEVLDVMDDNRLKPAEYRSAAQVFQALEVVPIAEKPQLAKMEERKRAATERTQITAPSKEEKGGEAR